MECNAITVECTLGEPINISVYGDTHEESEFCDYKFLRKHMDRRAALPNARFIGIGDMGDLILPNDSKRYMPSAGNRKLKTTRKATKLAQQGHDALIDQVVQDFLDDYSQYPWDMFGIGNHEHETLKRHYSNVGWRICQGLNCKYGGYSGFLRYSFRVKNHKHKNDWGCSLNILYHHGAWGGRVMKGFGGARDYARMFEGWDIFCFGHNHHIVVHQEGKGTFTQWGTYKESNRYFVNCGTFLRTQGVGTDVSYGERKGYPPVALGAPLITVVPHRKNKCEISVSVGDV